MLLKDFTVETELGEIKTIVAHCDYCGKKHMIGSDMTGGAMDWLEVRRFDRDIPPIHFCNLDHLEKGAQVFREKGIKILERGNWPLINGICSRAEGKD